MFAKFGRISANLHDSFYLLEIVSKPRQISIKLEHNNGSIYWESEVVGKIWKNCKTFGRIFCWQVEVWAVQKYVNLVDLVKCLPASIYLQKSASIQPRRSLSKFGGKFNSLFIRLLRGDSGRGRSSVALSRGIGFGWPGSGAFRRCVLYRSISRRSADKLPVWFIKAF